MALDPPKEAHKPTPEHTKESQKKPGLLKDSETRQQIIISALIGIIAYLGSLLLPGVTAHILRDVAIAIAVGIYLMFTLERINAERIEKEVRSYVEAVGENFISAVYGKDLPLDLFHVVKDSIFQQTFVRTLYNIDVRLNDFTERYIEATPPDIRTLLHAFRGRIENTHVKHEHLIVVQFTTIYEVLNVSRARQEYEVKWAISKPFGGNYEGLCGIISVQIDGDEQLKNVYLKSDDETQNPSMLYYVRKVPLKPKAKVNISIDSYSVRPNDDREQWQTLIPSQGMTVTVTDADGNKDIGLARDAPLIEGTERYTTKDARTNKAMMRITQYLLPYQGVTIFWTPKASSIESAKGA